MKGFRTLPLLGLAMVMAVGGCGSTGADQGTEKGAAGGDGTALCKEASVGGTSKAIPSLTAFAKDVAEDESGKVTTMEALCALESVTCRANVIVSGTGQDKDLSVARPDGTIVHFGEVFASQSGTGCQWSPETVIQAYGTYVVVEQSGAAYEREAGECHDADPAFYAAVVDVKSAALLAEFGCGGEGEPGLRIEGGQLNYETCEGKTISGPVNALRSCEK